MAHAKASAEKNGSKTAHSQDFVNELNGMARENYFIGLDAAHSLLEENKRFIDAQLKYLSGIQKEYAENVKSVMDALPPEYSRLGSGKGVKSILDIQGSYFSLIKKASDSYSKELLDLHQKLAERAFSALDRFVNALEP